MPDNNKDGVEIPQPLPYIDSHKENIHPVYQDMHIHTIITKDMDWDHVSAMRVALGECSDEQLLAEIARRDLDIQDSITEAIVKKTYAIGNVLGHGSSGKPLLARINSLTYC